MARAQSTDLGPGLVDDHFACVDRRWIVVMLMLPHQWNLRQWHDWLLAEMDLRVGQDYRWAWRDNQWAIEFFEAKTETAVRLKADIRD